MSDATPATATEIARLAAAYAIEQFRGQQKRGRDDRGSGSEEVGSLVRKYRTAEDWTITEVADLSGLHETTVGKIEHGQRGMSLYTFSRLVYSLGLGFAEEVLREVGRWPVETS